MSEKKKIVCFTQRHETNPDTKLSDFSKKLTQREKESTQEITDSGEEPVCE